MTRNRTTDRRAELDRPPAIEFCGVITPIEAHPFTIGRDADLSIDDNPHLHRRLLSVERSERGWALVNVGRHLVVHVHDEHDRLAATIAPGGWFPLHLAETVVCFAAGPSTYQLSVLLADALDPASSSTLSGPTAPDLPGVQTHGRPQLTPDQFRVVLALAEPTLLQHGRRGVAVPSSTDAARRLGWTVKRFNRKLDHLCLQLADVGVRGVRGRPGRLAADRKYRLVDFVTSTRLVCRADLALLDTADPP